MLDWITKIGLILGRGRRDGFPSISTSFLFCFFMFSFVPKLLRKVNGEKHRKTERLIQHLFKKRKNFPGNAEKWDDREDWKFEFMKFIFLVSFMAKLSMKIVRMRPYQFPKTTSHACRPYDL
jgi:hypothetical protein